MIGLAGEMDITFGNIVSTFPLGLEEDGLYVPVIDGGGDCVHGHDLPHKRRGNHSREISDENIGVSDSGEGNVVFEVGSVFEKGRGISVIFLMNRLLG